MKFHFAALIALNNGSFNSRRTSSSVLCYFYKGSLAGYKIMPAAQEREQHIKSAAAATATAAKGVCIFISKQHT
jgi:hypothetical protein